MTNLFTRRALRRVATGVAATAAAATLASCGGHDDGGPTPVAAVPTNTPPASAALDVAGFIAYLKVLVATKPESTEPLDVAAFVAPTTETGDPDPSI